MATELTWLGHGSWINTWPSIAQDAAAWAERVRQETPAEPIVVEPGGKILL